MTDESRKYQESIKLDSKILIAGKGIVFPVRRDPRGRQNADLRERIMRRTTTMIMALGLIGGASLASIRAVQAQVLASGPLFGGPSEAIVQCYIANVSASAVGLSNPQIIDEFNKPETITNSNCPDTLAAGNVCRFNSKLASTDLERYCSIDTVTTTAGQVRGGIEVRTTNNKILATGEMR